MIPQEVPEIHHEEDKPPPIVCSGGFRLPKMSAKEEDDE